jgi:hypothetical protein
LRISAPFSWRGEPATEPAPPQAAFALDAGAAYFSGPATQRRMPRTDFTTETPLMATDPALEAHEHAEHAQHAAHANDPFISRVSITVAILAVLAATVGSLETIEAGGAITASSEAVLAQDEATDAWSEYQADSLKKHIYGIAAEAGGPNAGRYKSTSDEQVAKQAPIKTHATELQAERDKLLKESREHEHRHHWLTAAATALEVGIAVCTVAIITRKRSFWYGSLGLAAAGLALFAVAYFDLSSLGLTIPK